MNVLTDNQIYYNVDDKQKKQGFFQRAGDKLRNIEQNPLFQTGASAYGGYLQQKYQGGGFQPLNTTDSGRNFNQPPLPPVVTGDEPRTGMSRGTKICIGIGVAAIIGIVIFVVVKNKKKGKK